MSMKLYSAPLSPFSARVRAAIYAKGLDMEIVTAPSGAELRSDAFRRLNPLGKIPVLITEDGLALPESAIIIDYLEDVHPEKSLLPEENIERARARLIARVAELYVMQAVTSLFPFLDTPDRTDAIEPRLRGLEAGLGRLAIFLDGAKCTLVQRSFSIADCMLIPMVFYLNIVKTSLDRPQLFENQTGLSAYAKAIESDAVASRVTAEMDAGLEAIGR